MSTRPRLDRNRSVLGVFALVLMVLSIIITSCERESSKLVETPVEPPALTTVEGPTPAIGNTVPESTQVPPITVTEADEKFTTAN